MSLFDPITKLRVDMAASFAANDEQPDYAGALIDIITDEHIKQGLREVFKDCDGYTDELLPKLLVLYHAADEIEAKAKATARAMALDIISRMI